MWRKLFEQWLSFLFLFLLCLPSKQAFANEVRKHRDTRIGISAEVPHNWNVKEQMNGFALIHKSQLANCVFGLQAIPGVEYLTREELDEETIRYYNRENLERILNEHEKKKNTPSLIEKRFLILTLDNIVVDGIKAVEFFTIVEVKHRLPMTKSEENYTVDKKARSLTFLTNEGNYNVTCTSGYGDFEISNRAFDVILGSVKLED